MTDASTLLPGEAPGVTRWTVARKAALLTRIQSGALTESEACELYGFSVEELQTWTCRLAVFGLSGLCNTKLQDCRA